MEYKYNFKKTTTIFKMFKISPSDIVNCIIEKKYLLKDIANIVADYGCVLTGPRFDFLRPSDMQILIETGKKNINDFSTIKTMQKIYYQCIKNSSNDANNGQGDETAIHCINGYELGEGDDQCLSCCRYDACYSCHLEFENFTESFFYECMGCFHKYCKACYLKSKCKKNKHTIFRRLYIIAGEFYCSVCKETFDGYHSRYLNHILDHDVCLKCSKTQRGKSLIQSKKMVLFKGMFDESHFGEFQDWVPVVRDFETKDLLLYNTNPESCNFQKLCLSSFDDTHRYLQYHVLFDSKVTVYELLDDIQMNINDTVDHGPRGEQSQPISVAFWKHSVRRMSF